MLILTALFLGQRRFYSTTDATDDCSGNLPTFFLETTDPGIHAS
jgi:hypothetical protein